MKKGARGMREAIKEIITEMEKSQRIKQLEGYLERYTAITNELYRIGGQGEWILEDDCHDELIKLRQDIKNDDKRTN